jgi:hypothetical protein
MKFSTHAGRYAAGLLAVVILVAAAIAGVMPRASGVSSRTGPAPVVVSGATDAPSAASSGDPWG